MSDRNLTQHLSADAPPPGEGRTLSAKVSRTRFFIVVPLVSFVGVVALFIVGLRHDPSSVPSSLIGRPVPKFSLPPVEGRTLGLSSENLKGEVSLVNVFASWCIACRAEHSLFMDLHAKGTVPIHGIDYKDEPENAWRWLNTLGDPYTRTGADRDGRVSIDWGVYGVPETFVVGPDGVVRYKHIGAVDERAPRETILPLVERLRLEQVQS
jgi:cytochrome c biogenesis protein CcmG, thiol:disulfide interchange protein DsbE